ncbi:MAG: cellulase family glycosylhydrolase [Candidatus Ranarchaeia archaeon]
MQKLVSELLIDGIWFRDQAGRISLLRGINLGGSSKFPKTPEGATHRDSAYHDPVNVSFIGRPFPLSEAHEHFRRLQSWGFNVIRLLTTWEAIEHAGPGQYDTGYLSYLRDIVELAGDYGFWVFVDPHQDVWSRFTGGDGAPAWVFDKVGLNWKHFDAADAAVLMHTRYPCDYPVMGWPGNAQRFACATMFTLFFGGNDFAPNTKVNGVPVQEYLQESYLNAILEVVKRLKDFPHLLGYGPMNEPSPGYIGIKDLAQPDPRTPPGLQISGFDGMVAAAGISRRVPFSRLKGWRVKTVGFKTINPGGVSVWMPNATDIWQDHNVWRLSDPKDPGSPPRLLKPDYFSNVKGKKINFLNDYLKPFVLRFIHRVREIHPTAWILIENPPLTQYGLEWKRDAPPNIVNAPHWYDAMTVYTKKLRRHLSFDVFTNKVVFSSRNVTKMFHRQLSLLKQLSNKMGGCPTLIGEFGIPFDMNWKKAYSTCIFDEQAKAFHVNYTVLDNLFLSSILWNYTADNTNQWGDGWNMEDFSIFSHDQQSNPLDINSGGRAVKGFCRPYPRFTAGVPIKLMFNPKNRVFVFEFEADGNVDIPTEIYVPLVQYPHGYNVQLSNGYYERDMSRQVLYVFTSNSGAQTVRINPI